MPNVVCVHDAGSETRCGRWMCRDGDPLDPRSAAAPSTHPTPSLTALSLQIRHQQSQRCHGVRTTKIKLKRNKNANDDENCNRGQCDDNFL